MAIDVMFQHQFAVLAHSCDAIAGRGPPGIAVSNSSKVRCRRHRFVSKKREGRRSVNGKSLKVNDHNVEKIYA
jgi:hypothetical protein